jgi:hypothetical protein
MRIGFFKELILTKCYPFWSEQFNPVGIAEINEEEIGPGSQERTSPCRGTKAGGEGMVTAEANDRGLFSLLKKIDIGVFFPCKDFFDDGDCLDVAGSCSEKDPLPLYLVREVICLSDSGTSLQIEERRDPLQVFGDSGVSSRLPRVDQSYDKPRLPPPIGQGQRDHRFRSNFAKRA